MYKKPVSFVPTPILIETPPSARRKTKLAQVSFQQYSNNLKRNEISQSLDSSNIKKGGGILKNRMRSYDNLSTKAELKSSGRDARSKWLDKVQPRFMNGQDMTKQKHNIRSSSLVSKKFHSNKNNNKFNVNYPENLPESLPRKPRRVSGNRFLKTNNRLLKPTRTQSQDRFGIKNVSGDEVKEKTGFVKNFNTSLKPRRPLSAKNKNFRKKVSLKNVVKNDH